MTDYTARVAGQRTEPDPGLRVEWVDRAAGIARATLPDGQMTLVVVEGRDRDWWVTLRGRRIRVEVLNWREELLAEAETSEHSQGGPLTVSATLPGLVVAVAVQAGDEVAAGDPLLTIEAMKMQNEVRAPRAGRVAEVTVASGQAVVTGAALLRLE